MVIIHKIRCFFSILIILLIFPSCAELKNRLFSQTSVQAPVQAPVQTQTPAQMENQAKHYLGTGEYQKAIDFYKTKHEKHPQDRLLVKCYVNILEDIKTDADRASDRKDLALAGKTYNILLKNYPDFKVFADMLSFDRAQLNSRLANCKITLSRKGFQAYRAGDIGEAISLWQDNLAIDPNNTDIKKALNTAKMQQKNLQTSK